VAHPGAREMDSITTKTRTAEHGEIRGELGRDAGNEPVCPEYYLYHHYSIFSWHGTQDMAEIAVILVLLSNYIAVYCPTASVHMVVE
jgi:hypothetical protein